MRKRSDGNDVGYTSDIIEKSLKTHYALLYNIYSMQSEIRCEMIVPKPTKKYSIDLSMFGVQRCF